MATSHVNRGFESLRPGLVRRLRLHYLPLVLCASVAAQESPPAPKTEPALAPEVIEIADIPVRAEEDTSFAQEIIDRSQRASPVVTLQPKLDELAQTVLKQRALFKRDALRKMQVIRLESLDRKWNFFSKQLGGWRDQLVQASNPYLEDAERLGRQKAEWKATQAVAESGGAPAALIARISSVQTQLEQAEQAISAPLGALLTLRQRSSRVAANIESAKKETAEAIAYIDARLAMTDSPPIWSMPHAPGESAANVAEAGLRVEVEFVGEYARVNNLLLRSYVVLELALLLLLLWFSARVRRWPMDDPQTAASIRILRRPFSTWLLIVLTGVLLVESDAPILLHQIALILMIVPLLRLLPQHVYVVLGPWPYVISALFLLDLLSIALLANADYPRFYLLALTLLAMSMLVWFLIRRRQKAREQHATPNGTLATSLSIALLRVAGWLSVSVFAASVVANVFGNVSLAEMLTEALLTSAFVALVFFAGVHVITSLATLALTKTPLAQLTVVQRHGVGIVRVFTRLLRLVALCGWTVITLNQFRIYRPTYQAVVGVLTHKVTFGEISLTLGGVLTFAFSVFLAVWVSRTVRFLLRDEILPNMSLPRGVANSVASLTYYLLIIGGLAVALVASGFQVGQLAFAIGALGVGIGLGLQDVVRNFVSGLILMFERPIQPGDIVDVGGTAGKIRVIGMRATTLATFDGAEVVVPNGMLLAEKLTNWTLSNMNRRFEVKLGVAYGTDPKRVLELVMETTRGTPGIASHPEPVVLFSGMGESSLDFALQAWTNNYSDWVTTRSDLTVRLHDALVAAGIEIPFPQQDVRIRSVAPEVQSSPSSLVEPPAVK